MDTQNISGLFASGVISSGNNVANAKRTNSTVKENAFDNFLGSNRKVSDNRVSLTDSKVSDTGNKTSVKTAMSKNKPSGSDVLKTSKSVDKVEISDVADVEEVDVTSASEQILAMLAQLFGITVDEVKEILGQADMDASDLMFQIQAESNKVTLVNTDAIRDFVMDVHGIEDNSSFLMNSTLYEELSAVTDAVTEIVAQMFGVAPDELDMVEENLALSFVEQLLAQTQSSAELSQDVSLNPSVDEQEKTVVKESDFTVVVEKMPEKAISNNKDLQGDFEGEAINSVSDNEAEGDASEKNLTTQNTTESSYDGQQENAESGNPQNEGDDFAKTSGEVKKNVIPESATPETMRHEFTEQLAKAFGENTENVQAPEALMNRIVEQIVRQVRIRVLPETTSLEMQLTPATLGKVHLQVSVTGGISTASMTVENQAAKEALESQMIQLKESFAEQGLKVDAVEVTVSEFGLRHDQGQKQTGEQTQEKENKRAFREDAGIAGMEEETESNVTESVRRDRNSIVDYTV